MNNLNSTPETITIPLTNGQQAIIDIVDADLALSKWNDYRGYVRRNTTWKKATKLHRVILERIIGRSLDSSEMCDHINGNPLDNRRENLRIADKYQNARNRGKSSLNKSGYKGVSRRATTTKWVAQIRVNAKNYHIGLFNTAEEAYAAYCEAGKRLHGEFWNPG